MSYQKPFIIEMRWWSGEMLTYVNTFTDNAKKVILKICNFISIDQTNSLSDKLK